MQSNIIQKYNRPVPRYTSYPPANFFGPITEADYLSAVEASNSARQNHISFYIHMPFCRQLCHYCGCHSYPMENMNTIEAYVKALHQEIDIVAKYLAADRKISQIHYGGGSPTAIPIKMIRELNEHLLSLASTIEKPEIAIECHPGYLTSEDWQALTTCGFTRYSLGIQDLRNDVLKVVGRKPSLLPVGDILDLLRNKGASVNLDLIYGLPLQTAESFSETITQVAAWRPNRLVTFSYAHLPKMFPRQQVLDRVGLPADDEKNRMYEEAARILKAEGYAALGLDHFVLPDDELGIALAKGELHRNFQGYCTRRTTGQVYAFGVTAISQLDQGYAQNGRDIHTYIERIGSGSLYVERGYQLTEQEKLVREVIEALMCNYALDWQHLADDLGVTPDQLREACLYDEEKMREMASDGLITIENQQLTVHTEGRPFVRNVAAALDPLMRHNDKTFSKPI